MPDTYGWPTPQECIRKVETVLQEAAQADLLGEMEEILLAVIAEVQSPAGMGGTGRRFQRLTETRLFNGSGQAHLNVDDIVPGSTITVTVGTAPLPNVVLAAAYHGQGHNVLARQSRSASSPLLSISGRQPIFPSGVQNISVNATWGYASLAPRDVYEAVRCEVAYRALVEGAVGLDGVGEEIQIGSFRVNTGQTAFASPLSNFHDTYVACVERYRTPELYVAARMMKRMY